MSSHVLLRRWAPGWILRHPTGSRGEEKKGVMVRGEVERLAEKTAERHLRWIVQSTVSTIIWRGTARVSGTH